MHIKDIVSTIALVITLVVSAESAQAETLLVTWTESSLGVSASWEQSSTPTPNSYSIGYFTDVPIWDFTSTGTTTVGPYSDIIWYNSGLLGGFNTPDNAYGVVGMQVYSSQESAPMFGTGVYGEFDAYNGAAATVMIADIPEPSTWAMMMLGFAGLAFAGYRRARAGNATPLA
jgi:PEP-CTERM motif